MTFSNHRELILSILLLPSRRPSEEDAWTAIQSIHTEAASPARGELEQKARLDDYVYRLGLIFAHYSGTMPGYSKSENETRFERFVCAIPAPAGLRITRHLVKGAIRRLDAKRNVGFIDELKEWDERDAAE